MNKSKFFVGAALLALSISSVAYAETTRAVTQKTSVVNPDGSVSYQSRTVTSQGAGDTVIVAPAPVTGATATSVTTTRVVKPGTLAGTVVTPMTFYYYNPTLGRIVSSSALNEDILALWDKDNNNVIDNHEFYSSALIVYEPTEYSKRTYQDIDADGIPELTKEEYTVRLTQMPMYGQLNTDKKDGLTLYEFTGVGFQDADIDNDNIVTFDEFEKAFYHKEGLAPKPKKINE